MKISNKNRRCRGLETVEAALLLPLVLLVTFGALKYGWIFLKSQQLANCARQVARVAIRPDDRSAEITSMFNALMTQADITGATCVVTPGGGNQGVGGSVSVEISVATANVDILPMPGFIPTPPNLGATVTMSKEGP
jgi:Flp pilus assembly protein TadG